MELLGATCFQERSNKAYMLVSMWLENARTLWMDSSIFDGVFSGQEGGHGYVWGVGLERRRLEIFMFPPSFSYAQAFIGLSRRGVVLGSTHFGLESTR